MRRHLWLSASLAVYLSLFTAHIVAAQEPTTNLRLLAWSEDGTFLIGTTPGEVATLGDGTSRQLTVLWLLPSGGAPPRRLAAGFDPKLSQDGRLVTFLRFDTASPNSRWHVDLQSGDLTPHGRDSASQARAPFFGAPPGQVVWAPDGQQHAILVNQFFQAELWLATGNEPARQILVSPGEVFSDLAWRPDSQALAFIRTPLGSSTEMGGEVWRLDLAAQAVTQLSQNNVVDRSPVWSPDGSSLAVVRNERLVIVPAGRLQVETFEIMPALPGIQWLPQTQLTPPTAIRVLHHENNTCRDVPVGQIDTIPFEEYVKRVVPHEVFPSWPAETLKAQAVAARTYSWFFINQDPEADYHVTDWVNFQYMCDSTTPATDLAVDETRGEYLAFDDQIIVAFFSAENSSPTRSHPTLAYIQAVDDPVSFGRVRNGHGYGLGQWGAQRWAERHDWSYQAILRHYYTGVTLEVGAAISDTLAPNVSLITPWSDYYLTTNHLWLVANTSDDGGSITQTNIYLSTPLTTTRLFSETGPARPEGYLLDLSAWADQMLLTNSLVLTAEAFDGTGKRGTSPPVIVGLDRVEPTGLLTTTLIPSGTVIFTTTIPLSITLVAADTTAGVAQLGVGNAAWQVEGENFKPQDDGTIQLGQPVADAEALNGSALRATVAEDIPGYWYSRAEAWLPANQAYRAYFRLKVSHHAITHEVVSLRVIDLDSGALIGLHRLRGVDFRGAEAYQEFHLDFDHGGSLEFQVQFQDLVDVTFDRMIVLEHPMAYSVEPPFKYAGQRLKVIDAAGNVADDLLLFFDLENKVYLPLMSKK
jgi:hypothetical protein